jgi:hypothetical protein
MEEIMWKIFFVILGGFCGTLIRMPHIKKTKEIIPWVY